MEEARLNLVKSAIKAQQEEIGKIFARIEERQGKENAAYIESLSYQLHNLYCAFEDLFRIIAGFFENRIEDKARYHQELIRRMRLQIEGIRPALLSDESYKLLDSLRAFRHFFRHAYAYELDPRKVALALHDAIILRGLYQKDIDRFLAQLE